MIFLALFLIMAKRSIAPSAKNETAVNEKTIRTVFSVGYNEIGEVKIHPNTVIHLIDNALLPEIFASNPELRDLKLSSRSIPSSANLVELNTVVSESELQEIETIVNFHKLIFSLLDEFSSSQERRVSQSSISSVPDKLFYDLSKPKILRLGLIIENELDDKNASAVSPTYRTPYSSHVLIIPFGFLSSVLFSVFIIFALNFKDEVLVKLKEIEA